MVIGTHHAVGSPGKHASRRLQDHVTRYLFLISASLPKELAAPRGAARTRSGTGLLTLQVQLEQAATVDSRSPSPTPEPVGLVWC